MIDFKVSSRKNLESTLRQLEREKALLQHKSLESHRKAESEADRKRCLENEGDIRRAVDHPLIQDLWIIYMYDFMILLPNNMIFTLLSNWDIDKQSSRVAAVFL